MSDLLAGTGLSLAREKPCPRIDDVSCFVSGLLSPGLAAKTNCVIPLLSGLSRYSFRLPRLL